MTLGLHLDSAIFSYSGHDESSDVAGLAGHGLSAPSVLAGSIGVRRAVHVKVGDEICAYSPTSFTTRARAHTEPVQTGFIFDTLKKAAKKVANTAKKAASKLKKGAQDAFGTSQDEDDESTTNGKKAKKDGEKPRETCGDDGVCKCAEGHRCVQTWPPGNVRPKEPLDFSQGVEPVLAEDPQFVLGCPIVREGHDLISRTGYHSLNTECVARKCMCVLSTDPDDGETTQIIKIPSVSGTPKSLIPRFYMPDLDDKFVAQVLGDSKDKGATFSPEPLMMDPKTWMQKFPQMKKNMAKIMEHFNKEMKKLETDIQTAHKQFEKEQENPPKPLAEDASKEERQARALEEAKKANAEVKLSARAADTFEQFHSFQSVCTKMEQQAQRMGLADYGEAKGLNCHMDPEEKTKAYKAMDFMTELIQARHAAEAKAGIAKASIVMDDQIVAPLAALIQVQSSRTSLHGVRNAKASQTNMTRLSGTYRVRDAAWRSEVRNFLNSDSATTLVTSNVA